MIIDGRPVPKRVIEETQKLTENNPGKIFHIKQDNKKNQWQINANNNSKQQVD